jgi:hypothetical protein
MDAVVQPAADWSKTVQKMARKQLFREENAL